MARGAWRYDSVPGFQGVCLGCGMASEDARLFLAVRGTGETELMAVHPGCWPEDLDDKRYFVISMAKLIAGMKHSSGRGGGADEAASFMTALLNKAAMQWVEIQNAKMLKRARVETQSMIDAMKASILLEVCEVAREKVQEEMLPMKGTTTAFQVDRNWVLQYVREQREIILKYVEDDLKETIRKDVWSNAMSLIEQKFRDLIRTHDKHILRVVREAFRRAGA